MKVQPESNMNVNLMPFLLRNQYMGILSVVFFSNIEYTAYTLKTFGALEKLLWL